MQILDNVNKTMRDDLAETIAKGDKLSVAAACFSINGCILADSVGLGKTFTAIAVIKYYELRNARTLVLCPKKLSDNWNTYKGNYLNNPVAEDRLNYTVLYHTDLPRDGGHSNGIGLGHINWSNYDLVVIDESHNSRNGEEYYGDERRENRYLVDFNSGTLVEEAAKALNKNLSVTEVTYTRTTGEGYLDYEVTGEKTRRLSRAASVGVKYDIAQKISDGANLSRRTVMAIMQRLAADKLMMFDVNPEEFISKAIMEIDDCKADIVVQAVRYMPSGEPEYTREIFNMSKTSEEYRRAYEAAKAIQKYVFTDGSAGDESIERRFAKDLDKSEEVAVYAKLPKGPKGFNIPTPVGNYSPDWAISFKKGSVRYIYFVAEAKGTMDTTQFRPVEKAKIDCAMKLFNEASASGVKYHFVDSYRTLIDDVMNRDL